ncbi:unnamed protein product [Amoebophrya sp. A120]|nr:unnamed protein product [Amoebophrya sp. A120]|eukprot:GSA120T00005477001.1
MSSSDHQRQPAPAAPAPPPETRRSAPAKAKAKPPPPRASRPSANAALEAHRRKLEMGRQKRSESTFLAEKNKSLAEKKKSLAEKNPILKPDFDKPYSRTSMEAEAAALAAAQIARMKAAQNPPRGAPRRPTDAEIQAACDRRKTEEAAKAARRESHAARKQSSAAGKQSEAGRQLLLDDAIEEFSEMSVNEAPAEKDQDGYWVYGKLPPIEFWLPLGVQGNIKKGQYWQNPRGEIWGFCEKQPDDPGEGALWDLLRELTPDVKEPSVPKSILPKFLEELRPPFISEITCPATATRGPIIEGWRDEDEENVGSSSSSSSSSSNARVEQARRQGEVLGQRNNNDANASSRPQGGPWDHGQIPKSAPESQVSGEEQDHARQAPAAASSKQGTTSESPASSAPGVVAAQSSLHSPQSEAVPGDTANTSRSQLQSPVGEEDVLVMEEVVDEEVPTPEQGSREIVEEEIVEEEIIEEEHYGGYNTPASSLGLPPSSSHSNALLPHETANAPFDVASSVNGTHRAPSTIAGSFANPYPSGSTARDDASVASYQTYGSNYFGANQEMAPPSSAERRNAKRPSFKEELIEEEIVEEEVVPDQADNHSYYGSAAPSHWTFLNNDQQSSYQSHGWGNSKPSWLPHDAQMAEDNISNPESMLPGALDDVGSLYDGEAGAFGAKDAQDGWNDGSKSYGESNKSIVPASQEAKDWRSKYEDVDNFADLVAYGEGQKREAPEDMSKDPLVASTENLKKFAHRRPQFKLDQQFFLEKFWNHCGKGGIQNSCLTRSDLYRINQFPDPERTSLAVGMFVRVAADAESARKEEESKMLEGIGYGMEMDFLQGKDDSWKNELCWKCANCEAGDCEYGDVLSDKKDEEKKYQLHRWGLESFLTHGYSVHKQGNTLWILKKERNFKVSERPRDSLASTSQDIKVDRIPLRGEYYENNANGGAANCLARIVDFRHGEKEYSCQFGEEGKTRKCNAVVTAVRYPWTDLGDILPENKKCTVITKPISVIVDDDEVPKAEVTNFLTMEWFQRGCTGFDWETDEKLVRFTSQMDGETEVRVDRNRSERDQMHEYPPWHKKIIVRNFVFDEEKTARVLVQRPEHRFITPSFRLKELEHDERAHAQQIAKCEDTATVINIQEERQLLVDTVLPPVLAAVKKNRQKFEADERMQAICMINERNMRNQDILDHRRAEAERSAVVKQQQLKKDLEFAKQHNLPSTLLETEKTAKPAELNPFARKDCHPRHMWHMETCKKSVREVIVKRRREQWIREGKDPAVFDRMIVQEKMRQDQAEFGIDEEDEALLLQQQQRRKRSKSKEPLLPQGSPTKKKLKSERKKSDLDGGAAGFLSDEDENKVRRADGNKSPVRGGGLVGGGYSEFREKEEKMSSRKSRSKERSPRGKASPNKKRTGSKDSRRSRSRGRRNSESDGDADDEGSHERGDKAGTSSNQLQDDLDEIFGEGLEPDLDVANKADANEMNANVDVSPGGANISKLQQNAGLTKQVENNPRPKKKKNRVPTFYDVTNRRHTSTKIFQTTENPTNLAEQVGGEQLWDELQAVMRVTGDEDVARIPKLTKLSTLSTDSENSDEGKREGKGKGNDKQGSLSSESGSFDQAKNNVVDDDDDVLDLEAMRDPAREFVDLDVTTVDEAPGDTNAETKRENLPEDDDFKLDSARSSKEDESSESNPKTLSPKSAKETASDGPPLADVLQAIHSGANMKQFYESWKSSSLAEGTSVGGA